VRRGYILLLRLEAAAHRPADRRRDAQQEGGAVAASQKEEEGDAAVQVGERGRTRRRRERRARKREAVAQAVREAPAVAPTPMPLPPVVPAPAVDEAADVGAAAVDVGARSSAPAAEAEARTRAEAEEGSARAASGSAPLASSAMEVETLSASSAPVQPFRVPNNEPAWDETRRQRSTRAAAFHSRCQAAWKTCGTHCVKRSVLILGIRFQIKVPCLSQRWLSSASTAEIEAALHAVLEGPFFKQEQALRELWSRSERPQFCLGADGWRPCSFLTYG
jgi:hypothetical protein